MAAFTNLNDRAKIEHCLRFLASHQLLAKVMWTADTREQFSEAMQSMFDTKSADETIQKVCDQVVVSTFHIITAEFKLFIEDDKRLDVCNVIRAIKVLDDHELEEEANFIIMCILVHTALHLILSSPDAKDAWPTANKLLHKRESVEESARIASLRSEALLLVKSCVQKSLQKGPKAMATHAAQFEPPISSVMAQLSKYTQRLSERIGELWKPPRLHRIPLEEGENGSPGSGRKHKRWLQSPNNSRSPPKKRKRGREDSRVEITPTNDAEKSSYKDSNSEISGTSAEIVLWKSRTSAQKPREFQRNLAWQSPTRSVRAKKNIEDNDEDEVEDELTQSQKKTLRKLDGATKELKKVRGKDPLDEAVENSRAVKGSLYRLSPNARDATPITDDDELSAGERARSRLSRTMPSKLTLFSPRPRGRPKTSNDNSDSPYDPDKAVMRKGPFSAEEDGALINGLKKYGWSEWHRIASHSWNRLAFRRTAMQVKDRSRYLHKTGRIDREDFPCIYAYRRSGPASAVNPSVLNRTPDKKNMKKDWVDTLEDEITSSDSDDHEDSDQENASNDVSKDTAEGDCQADVNGGISNKQAKNGDNIEDYQDDSQKVDAEENVEDVNGNHTSNGQDSKEPGEGQNGSVKTTPSKRNFKKKLMYINDSQIPVKGEDPESFVQLRRSSRPHNQLIDISSGKKRRGRKSKRKFL